MIRSTFFIAFLLTAFACASELTPAELALKKLLGEGTPDPIHLWAGTPPRFVENAPPEVVAGNAQIKMISVPTITVYPALKETNTGMAIIICPGGGYGAMD
jgi:hypothetical protein